MRSTLVLLGTLLLISCDGNKDLQATGSGEKQPSVVAENTVVAAEIQWFDGGVDAAFAHAAAHSKPIFLYWGAIWCPPCQEIKHTVFKSQAFIELSELFVPVYLDGDTERAQVRGESFGVKGYPTMIVFDPEGVELTRIPGGIDIERYNAVLALALDEMRPTADLVALALEAPDQLRPQDFQQLAYYSWWQDSAAVSKDTDQTALFRQLMQAAPPGPLQARFFMNMLAVMASQPDAMLDPVETRMLSDILSSDELTLACWDSLAYGILDLLPLVDPVARDSLSEKWSAQLYGLRTHASLSTAEGLAGWLPRLALANGQLDDATRFTLTQELGAAEKATTDNYERQSVVYQISEIFRAANLDEEAKTLLLAELDRSASPYYFMSGLAAMAEEAGDVAGALTWRMSAWDAAQGEATRFQWGVSYLQALIRLAPDQTEDIRATTDKVMAEVSSRQALFAGRNYRRLSGLGQAITQWEQDHHRAGTSFIESLAGLCEAQIKGSQARKNCLQLAGDNELARVD